MRQIKPEQFFSVKAEGEVIVSGKGGVPKRAVAPPSDPKNLPKFFKVFVVLVIKFVMSKVPDATMWIGELTQVHTIIDSDEDVLWYEDEDQKGVYHPLSVDEAIHKWVAEEGLKLYSVV